MRRARPRSLASGVACAALLAACGDDGAAHETFAVATSQQVGGPGAQTPSAVAASKDRSIVAAWYEGSFSIGDRTIAAAGGLDAVVLSFEDGGHLAWAHELAGSGEDSVLGLATDGEGSVFVSGEATQGATFAGQQIPVAGRSALFVAKVDRDGSLVWLRSAGGGGFQSAMAVAPASDGGVFVAGDFTADLDFAGAAATGTDLSDAFVARLSASGELRWLTPVSGAGAQHLRHIAVGPDDAVTVIGHYKGELGLAEPALPGNPATDHTPFVARFGADGEVAWVQTKLLPADLNHMGHLDYSQVHHFGVAVLDLVVAVTPGGETLAGVTFGGTFSLSAPDFEAPAINRLMLTTIGSDGRSLSQREVHAEGGLLRLGQIVATDRRIYLATSWIGTMTDPSGGPAIASDDHWSVIMLDPEAPEGFTSRGTFGLDGAALTGVDAVVRPDASMVMAAKRTDLASLDEDIFLARLR